jgi:hypothetical protein
MRPRAWNVQWLAQPSPDGNDRLKRAVLLVLSAAGLPHEGSFLSSLGGARPTTHRAKEATL